MVDKNRVSAGVAPAETDWVMSGATPDITLTQTGYKVELRNQELVCHFSYLVLVSSRSQLLVARRFSVLGGLKISKFKIIQVDRQNICL